MPAFAVSVASRERYNIYIIKKVFFNVMFSEDFEIIMWYQSPNHSISTLYRTAGLMYEQSYCGSHNYIYSSCELRFLIFIPAKVPQNAPAIAGITNQ
jgi:hypothetical protein